MKKTPLQQVRERFESKEGLVSAVRELMTDDLALDRLDEDKGLESVSNSKLLRLHEVLTAVKKEHGSRDALIDALLKLESHVGDAGYRSRFEAWPTPRLWDRYQAAKRRAARAG